jgi:hypothetical protein
MRKGVMQSRRYPSQVIAVFLLATSFSAEAYIGPGAGIGAIGTVVALFGAILLAIVAFVWYPVKRLLRTRKREPNHEVNEKEQINEEEPADP